MNKIKTDEERDKISAERGIHTSMNTLQQWRSSRDKAYITAEHGAEEDDVEAKIIIDEFWIKDDHTQDETDAMFVELTELYMSRLPKI